MLEDECPDGNAPSNSLSDEDSLDEEGKLRKKGWRTRTNGLMIENTRFRNDMERRKRENNEA